MQTSCYFGAIPKVSNKMNWQKNKSPMAIDHRACPLPSDVLDYQQNCFCDGNNVRNVGEGCTKVFPQRTTTFPLKIPTDAGF